jgi:hypothetical protein
MPMTIAITFVAHYLSGGNLTFIKHFVLDAILLATIGLPLLRATSHSTSTCIDLLHFVIHILQDA